MCLSLEHQNPSKTSEKMGYFDSVTVSLHILCTANQETEGLQDRLTVQYKIRNLSVFYSALRARRPSVVLRAVRKLAVIDFQNGEQQSRSGSVKKRRNRLQWIHKDHWAN